MNWHYKLLKFAWVKLTSLIKLGLTSYFSATDAKNGGLISLDELRTRLIKARGQSKVHQEISKDDLMRAAQKLKIFGSGFNVIPVGKGKVCEFFFKSKSSIGKSVFI